MADVVDQVFKQLVVYAIPLYYDNQLAIFFLDIHFFHARTKHVKIHYHFIQEKVY